MSSVAPSLQPAFLDVRSQIATLEPLLHAAGCPVARLCVLAGIYPSAWVRWKQGKGARPENWHRVQEALRTHYPDAAERLEPTTRPGDGSISDQAA